MAHARIEFAHGSLGVSELVAAFGALPADITFIDADDVIRYFSEYRIFNRPESCIDTDVMTCHKSASRPAIDQILSAFRDGTQDEVLSPTTKDGRPVSVRYLAVRAHDGAYLGCLEIAQWAEFAAR